jgi:hypothetical protein
MQAILGCAKSCAGCGMRGASCLSGETAERGGEEEGKKDEKPEKQMADGGATRRLRWGL